MNKIEIVKNYIESLRASTYRFIVKENIDDCGHVWFVHLVGEHGLPELKNLKFNLKELEELYIFFIDHHLTRLPEITSLSEQAHIDRLRLSRKKSNNEIINEHLSQLIILNSYAIFAFLELDDAIYILNKVSNRSDDFFNYLVNSYFYSLTNYFCWFDLSLYRFIEIEKNKLQELIDSFISILKRLKNKNEKSFNEKLKDYINKEKKSLNNNDLGFRSTNQRAAATLSIRELEKI